MDNRSNRWLAGLSLFALFGVIALAGGRAQGTQNVLVTNTSSQPVQVAARPGTGAYIVSVANAPNVKVVASPTAPLSTKDVYNADLTSSSVVVSLTIAVGSLQAASTPFTFSSTDSAIVDAVNVYADAGTGQTADNIAITVMTGFALTSTCSYVMSTLPDTTDQSILSTNTRILVPPSGQLRLYAYRNGGTTTTCAVQYTLTYHPLEGLQYEGESLRLIRVPAILRLQWT